MAVRFQFSAEWNQHGATAGAVAPIVVEESPHSPTDIRMAAGCQGGFMSLESAIASAEALLSAAQALSAHIPPFAVEVVNDRIRRVFTADRVLATVAGVTLFYRDTLLTGPHAHGTFEYRIVPSPAIESMRNRNGALLEIKIIKRLAELLDDSDDHDIVDNIRHEFQIPRGGELVNE